MTDRLTDWLTNSVTQEAIRPCIQKVLRSLRFRSCSIWEGPALAQASEWSDCTWWICPKGQGCMEQTKYPHWATAGSPSGPEHARSCMWHRRALIRAVGREPVWSNLSRTHFLPPSPERAQASTPKSSSLASSSPAEASWGSQIIQPLHPQYRGPHLIYARSSLCRLYTMVLFPRGTKELQPLFPSLSLSYHAVLKESWLVWAGISYQSTEEPRLETCFLYLFGH